MSKYHQTSNPFESEEDEGDFSVVGKTAGSTNAGPRSSQYSSSSTATSYSSSSANRSSNGSAPASANRSSSVSSAPASANRSSSVSASTSAHSYPQRPQQNYSGTQYHEDESPFDDKRRQLQMKIANSENTQLESTQRALASIYESEAMGVATAEELLRQAETLNNIETKTDGMQQNMKVSQRHLNNIKSVFGGIKNWWSGGDKKAGETSQQPESANSRLRSTIEKTEKSRPDVSGFYDNDNDNDLDSRFMAGARKPGGGQYTVISPVTRSAREEDIDSNLGMMCDGMSRLKGLAMGLGDEIERQNEQLDRITVKVDKTDVLITHQNTQMKKILK